MPDTHIIEAGDVTYGIITDSAGGLSVFMRDGHQSWKGVRRIAPEPYDSPPTEAAHELLDRALRQRCRDCHGTGERVINPDWPQGEEPYSEKCSTCGSSGRVEL